MKQKARIACLQMNSSDKVEENLDFVAQQLSLANQQDVQLVLLPENFAQMPKARSVKHCEQAGSGVVQDFLAEHASKYAMCIIAGSLPIRVGDSDKPYARCLVYATTGSLLASYDKIHLFDVDLADGQKYRESNIYSAGAVSDGKGAPLNLVVTDTCIAKLGLSICYDLRFPEMYRTLTALGAEIIAVPAAFTYDTGQAHWQTLLQARAIENQVFVLAAAQVGKHSNGRQTWGHSMIIDPWGEILKVLPDSTGLVICDIDLTKLAKLRTDFPVLTHKRL